MNGMGMVNKLKLSLGKAGLADLMLMEGADDEKEFALMLNAQAFYLFKDGIRIKGKPVVLNESEEGFRNKMLLLGTHKGVRKAYMAEDYDKCNELANEYFATNPIEETRLRIEKFVDDNKESWIQKGYIKEKKQEVKK